MNQLNPMTTIEAGLKDRSLWVAVALILGAAATTIAVPAIVISLLATQPAESTSTAGEQVFESYRDLGQRHQPEDFGLGKGQMSDVQPYLDFGLRHGPQDFGLNRQSSTEERYLDFGQRHRPADLGLPSGEDD